MIKRLFQSKGRPDAKEPAGTSVEAEGVPKHVAIIMDGNGRWAREHGLPRVAGHHTGMNNVREITMAADRLGVKVLTLYAFSTENWKRPKDEVDYLMSLPQEFFPKMIGELEEKNVQVRMMGHRELLPEQTLQTVEEAVKRTESNTGLVLNFAFNYGGRKEILHSVQRLMEEAASGAVRADQLDESLFRQYLLSGDLPDPDLLIRTSGEIRLSNFMLWQLAYAELWFTDVFWPDFTEEHFQRAIHDYQKRVRRYGGL
ncbi:isoprenyl transferase [Xylanibacillus composti]|nr:isoprenyl transferase [Xylanibacillus composti]